MEQRLIKMVLSTKDQSRLIGQNGKYICKPKGEPGKGSQASHFQIWSTGKKLIYIPKLH